MASESDEMDLGFETIIAHLAEDPARYQGAVIPPIHQTSLFTFPNCEAYTATGVGPGAYYYSRYGNPTNAIVEAKIAALEGGADARTFGSGMGAIAAAIMSCVRAGEHVVAVDTLYGPTRKLLTCFLSRYGVTTTFVDGRDPGDFERAARPNTKLFYLESPSSVVFKQQDLAAVTEIARERNVSTVCDNSWASPLFQNPLTFGVDLVVHSATKYLGGHSDVVAGVVIGNAERMASIRDNESPLLGATLDPFAAWLLLRGLRTLSVRMERHQSSARTVAMALHEHPAVDNVFYPGLSDNPQAELTRKQLRGTSGLLSFTLRDPSKGALFRAIDSLKLFGIGCSWGGFESLAIPIAVPLWRLDGSGAETRWLCRIHVGLETVNDLLADLDRALARV